METKKELEQTIDKLRNTIKFGEEVLFKIVFPDKLITSFEEFMTILDTFTDKYKDDSLFITIYGDAYIKKLIDNSKDFFKSRNIDINETPKGVTGIKISNIYELNFGYYNSIYRFALSNSNHKVHSVEICIASKISVNDSDNKFLYNWKGSK